MVSQNKTGTRRVYDPVKRSFRTLCKSVRSPLGLAMLTWNDLTVATFKLNPADYQDASTFKYDYLLSSYLSKYKGLNTGIDTKEVALRNFAVAESICAESNRRLSTNKSTIVDPVLHRAQRAIARVLGPFSMTKLDGLERWGPGASSDLRRSEAYLDAKYAKLPITVTREAAPLLKRTIEHDLHWSYVLLGTFPDGPYSLLPESFLIEDGCKVDTVSKNATTDRTIGIEPRGNMFLQKAAGNFFRSRLRRFEVNLDDQSWNQLLASRGVTESLATIDLAMASDTICRQLIFELLPFDWAVYLDTIRSRRYTLPSGEVNTFEKFSSMGNGFTFELESLIFYGLVMGSQEGDQLRPWAVYGDDIIIGRESADVLITALAYCGFTTNVSKTFLDGPFRESCGKHYFNSEDVTPIYQKEVVVDELSHRRATNRIKRLAGRWNDGDRQCTKLHAAWATLYDKVRYEWHPQLPLGTEGDDGYLVTHNETKGLRPYLRSYGHKWQILVRVASRIPALEAALLADSLRSGCVTESPNFGDVTSRDKESVTYARGTRWIEPPWEFALD